MPSVPDVPDAQAGTETPGGLCEEARRIARWRFLEARGCGLTRVEARLYAESDIDAEQLRQLVRAGCPPGRIAKILL